MAMIAAVAATAFTTLSQIQQGSAAEQMGNYEAGQMERNAKAERAIAQRDSIEERRKTRLAQSRLQALAQGGAFDPTVANLDAALEGEGEYRALSALYEGETRALGLESQATATRFSAKQAKRASYMKATTTALSSGNSIYDNYK